MDEIKDNHLTKMQLIYKRWLESLDHPLKSEVRINSILNIFQQVSPPIFHKFVQGMRVVDVTYRFDQKDHMLLKVKMELFDKYFTFDMDHLTDKVTSTLTTETIRLLFTARSEPVAVICQRIVFRQYAVMNQKIEKRLKQLVNSDKFIHCDICGTYGLLEKYERLSQQTMKEVVKAGFHPHNSEVIVNKLAKVNNVAPHVITTMEHASRWLEFVNKTDDIWSICDVCLIEILPFYVD